MANLQGGELLWLSDVDQSGLPWGVKLRDGREIPIPRQDPVTGSIYSGGSLLALSEATPYVTKTTTGSVVGTPCELAGYDCIVAAGTIQIRDGGAAGTIIVPATALTVGRVEFLYKRVLTVDCYIELSGAATVNVLVG
jgi:hypothetical protein